MDDDYYCLVFFSIYREKIGAFISLPLPLLMMSCYLFLFSSRRDGQGGQRDRRQRDTRTDIHHQRHDQEEDRRGHHDNSNDRRSEESPDEADGDNIVESVEQSREEESLVEGSGLNTHHATGNGSGSDDEGVKYVPETSSD